MARKKQGKDTHDRKVRQLSNQLKKEGWKVQADVPGYETPSSIGQGQYIPDIVAVKGKQKKIIEVDTLGTEDSDQLSTFRRSAAQQDNTEFEHIITKPRKRK